MRRDPISISLINLNAKIQEIRKRKGEMVKNKQKKELNIYAEKKEEEEESINDDNKKNK